MSTVYVYFTNDKTGTVHLVPEDWWHRPEMPTGLCGNSSGFPNLHWVSGDETISGIAATCKTCRSAATARWWGR